MSEGRASVNGSSTGFFFFARICVVSIAMVAQAYGRQVPVIRDIEIHGVSAFSNQELVREFVSRPGAKYSQETLKSDLARMLGRFEDEGYLNVGVDSVSVVPDEQTVAIAVYVNEGRQSLIGTIGFRGNDSMQEAVLTPELPIRKGIPFVQTNIEQCVQAVLKLYERNGFPFAKVSVTNIAFSEEENHILVSYVYAIEEGKKVRIAELKVVGNTQTKESVILREARLAPDAVFTDQVADRIKRRLERLQLFSSVSRPELFVTQRDEGGLLLTVREGSPNSFDGIIGYVPSPRGGEDGYVTGLIDLRFRNLFGTARKLMVRWYRENQSSQEIGLQYAEPWVASFPVNAQVDFFQRVQDSTFVRRMYSLSADFMLSDELAIGANVARSDVVPTEGFGKTVLPGNESTSIGMSVAYDTRNDPTTPTSGIVYRSQYDVGIKNIESSIFGASSSGSTQRITMDLGFYLETFVHQVVVTELHIQDYRSSTIGLGELFRLGGASTLRGYRESQFLGSRIVWSTFEYRFLVDRRSYVCGFVDGGYIVTPEQPSIQVSAGEQLKIGYGIGIRLDSKLGLIGVNIALGEGDTFSTAKLHLRLVNAF